MWLNFDKENAVLLAKEPYQFFLVRPKGMHPVCGGKFLPSVVQLIDDQLYSADNELEPLVYSHKNDFLTPCADPFDCNLEWCEIP